ncbi:MAG: transposase [Oligoflexus sp.]
MQDYKVCNAFECELVEFDAEHDHVHLLISYHLKSQYQSLLIS